MGEHDKQPDRTNVSMLGTSLGMDNVYKAQTPTSLQTTPGEAGAKTEWDASTLDGAAKWLESHAEFLARMYHGMDDLKDLMNGPDGMTSPLGGFPWARELTSKHTSLQQSMQTGLKTVVENLYDAADAVRKVKEKYHSAEKASTMAGGDMNKVFSDLGRSDHDF
jgi:uncharacterized protein YukE